MKDPIFYAIADVHGRADHLVKMVDHAVSDARYWNGRPVFYFLGDIVDRGGTSRQSLEIVHEVLGKYDGSLLHPGNHDLWFLDAVMTRGLGGEVRDWEHCGGRDTLRSFFPDLKSKDALAAIGERYPHLVDMIARARPMTRHGRVVFCHAGVDRFRRLGEQDLRTLTWIRSPFLEIANNDQHVVVHGHTIFRHGPVVTDNRISLDTGCFMSNRLAACRFDPARRTIGFIVTSDSGRFVEVSEEEPRLLDRGYGTAMDRIDEIFDSWTDAIHDVAS